MAELSDVALDLVGSDPALLTTRRGARVVAGIGPVMRSEPIGLPNGLAPGAPSRRLGWRPARSLPAAAAGLSPAPRHKLVPARLGPLPAGCSA
jgi:hypothetical protein